MAHLQSSLIAHMLQLQIVLDPTTVCSLVGEIYLAVIVAFAAAVHGAIGIGVPMIATPLLALITDVRTAILLLVLPTVVLNAAKILKGGNWRHSIAVF
jgi:hypothetical protein